MNPQIRPYEIQSENNRILVKNRESGQSVALATQYLQFIDALSGKHSIKDLALLFVAQKKLLIFRDLLSTLRALEQAGLLTHPTGLKKTYDTDHGTSLKSTQSRELWGAVGAFFSNLFTTMIKGISSPLMGPYLRFSQALNTREDKSYDKEVLRTSLRATSFFQDLSPESLDFVIQNSKIRAYTAGTRLIIQDSDGDELFVLLEGSVKVLKRESSGLQIYFCTLHKYSVFGEIALVKKCRRTAGVVAKEHMRALVLTKSIFDSLLKEDHDRILDSIALGHYLSSIPDFRNLPSETTAVLRNIGVLERRTAGDIVIEEGDIGLSFFLILRGDFEVLKGTSVVGTLRQGEYFGKISLFRSSPRSATIRVRSATSLLLKIEQDAFWQVLLDNPFLASNIEDMATMRLSSVNES